MPPTRARGRNTRKPTAKQVKEEREKVKILYNLYKADCFDEEFFALLQSAAPEDQKLRESSVELEEGPDKKKALATKPPPHPRCVQKKPAAKKAAAPRPSGKKKPAPKPSTQKTPETKTPTTDPPTTSAIDANPTTSLPTTLLSGLHSTNTSAEEEHSTNVVDWSRVKGLDPMLACRLNHCMRVMEELGQKRKAHLTQDTGSNTPNVGDQPGDGVTGARGGDDAGTGNTSEQASKKRRSPEDDTNNTRYGKKVKGSTAKKAAETEAVVDLGDDSKTTRRRSDGKRKRKSDNINKTPADNAQLLSPPGSALRSIEDRQDVSPSITRPLTCLQPEPSGKTSNGQLISPISMSPPTALPPESQERPNGVVTEAPEQQKTPLPERWSPNSNDPVQLASTYSEDSPSSSCGYPFRNDIENPTSPVEICSKYFTNNQASSRKTIKDYFPTPEIVINNSAVPDPSEKKNPKKTRAKPKASESISKYFPISKAAVGSSLPFPSIERETFGLIQEKLAHEPFRLLVATIFLNRTKGHVAIPVLKEFFGLYPTIESVARAELKDVAGIFQPLGLHNQRASKLINLAKTWMSQPPEGGKRYRKLDYPKKKDGRDVGADECLDDDDHRVGWEIAHLPGIGPYGIDSWRIFCRDELRGLATDHKGAGAAEGFAPEWKSVLPQDKELRAYISWLWLKEGYSWDMVTGKVSPAKRPGKRTLKKIASLTSGNILDSGVESHGATKDPDYSPSGSDETA